MMDWTKWNERPTEVYVRVLRKEEASERVQGASSDGEHINLGLCP